MPQDVKRFNTLSISNQPDSDEWQPPTQPITDEWKPPTEPVGSNKSQEPNFLQRAFDFANKPIVDLMSPFTKEATEQFGHPGLNDSVNTARLKGFVSGGMQGLSDFISSQSSPLSMGLEAATAGAVGSKGAGLTNVANLLETPGKIAAGGMAAHGAYNMYDAPDLAGKMNAFPEMAMGLGGLGHMMKPKLPPREMKLLGPGVYEMPPSSLENKMPPEFQAVGDEDLAKKTVFKNMDQFRYDLARNKLKMGLDVPTLPHGIHPQEKRIPLGRINSDIEPQFAESGKSGVKIGADVRSLGKVLGSSLYKGDIAKIATKELLQNSLDAVRHLDENGKVEVVLKRPYGGKEHYIEVKDNGRGLSLKEIQSVFSDLGSSGKRDDANAIGGFGLAKAAPLLGGEKVEVTSIVKEGNRLLEHKFSGTPDELLDGVNIQTREIRQGTTGTTVRTYVPKNSDFYSAKRLVEDIAKNSPGTKAKISLNDVTYGEAKESDAEVHAPMSLEGANTTTLNSPSADVDIIVPKDAKYAPRNGVIYSVTNNGMYQTQGRYGYDQIPGVPDKIIVNIRSKVPEGHPDYPFTANREELRGTAHELVNKYLEDNVVKPAVGKRVEQLRKVYEGMPKLELNHDKGPFHRDFFLYDTNQKFTPEELKVLTENPHVKRLATDISEVLHEAMISTDNATWNDKLEKIGFIFDEGLKGIHIPNPGQNKSAILINPFSIMSSKNPNEAAAGILHTILHEMAHVEGGGHDEHFAYRLSEIYEAYGAENSVAAQSKIHDTIANAEGTGYHRSFQEILQHYNEVRGREGVESDPLRGTGIGSENKKSDRKRQIPINSSTTGSRTPSEHIVNRLVQALKGATVTRAEQENMYSMERAKRIARAESVVKPDKEGNIKNSGVAGFRKQQNTLKGELPKADYEGVGLKEHEVDTLIDNITNSQHLLPFEKIRAKVGLLKLIGGEQGVPQNNELQLLRDVFGKPFDEIVEMHGGFGGPVALKAITDVINVPKAIMASIDVSAPLRQGAPLIHKKEWWGALKPMMEALASQKNFDASQAALKDRVNYLLGKEAGLILTDMETHREEAYGSKLANVVPGVKASERAYVGFLNKLRADTFDSLIEDAKAQGLHPKDVMHEIANFVNTATGRGSLDFSQNPVMKAIGQGREGFGNLDKTANELNAVFFSPRLIASRLSILNPNYYIKASPFVRKEALKSLLALGTTSLTINGLMMAMGAKISTDPTNADFMKSKFDHTRLDPNAGFQQYIVAAARLVSGKTTSSVTGKTTELGKGFNAQTRRGVIGNLMENKLSPVASLADVLLTGKDFEGKPIDVTKEVRTRFTPMLINDMIELYKDDPNHLPLGIASALGMGVQTYGPTKNQSSKFKMRIR
jgi:hypothetical protein